MLNEVPLSVSVVRSEEWGVGSGEWWCRRERSNEKEESREEKKKEVVG